MQYNRKQLVYLGKHILQSNPEKARELVEAMPKQCDLPLSLVEGYFLKFCKWSKLEAFELQGVIYARGKSMYRKMFVSAMLETYGNAHGLQNKLSLVLNQNIISLRNSMKETKFWYKKDPDFRKKVDQFLKKIK